MATELTGKSIVELNQSPALYDSTNLVVQRDGATKAEKTQLNKLVEYLINSPIVTNQLQESAKSSVKNSIDTHVSSTDPHGDRAYANSVYYTHLNNPDPHGDRSYADSKINTHSKANDPHGDRAYTAQFVNTHTNAADPHGDRVYTNAQIVNHKNEVDPHGDRLFTMTTMMNHEQSSNDPHGDRAFSTNLMNNHKNETDPHGLYSKIISLIESHNTDSTSHGLDEKLNQITNTIRTTVDSNITQKIGTVLAPISFGKIPKEYIPSQIIFADYSAFPISGDENILYVDKTKKALFIWTGSAYSQLNSGSSSSSITTTDSIEQGVNLDRRYYTREIESKLNSKLSTVQNGGSGKGLTKSIDNGIVSLKGLVQKGSINIIDDGLDLSISTDEYNFFAKFNSDTILSSDTDLLDNLESNSLISIEGNISAIDYKKAGTKTLISNHNMWNIDALFGSSGDSTKLTVPSNTVISSNGLVVTGVTTPTTNVEVYNSDNRLLGKGISLTEGSFTIVLDTPEISGEYVRIYSVTDLGGRSKPAYLQTVNKSDLGDITGIVFNKAGTVVYGRAFRGSTIEIFNVENVSIGKGITNNIGTFEINLSTPLKSNDTISFKCNLNELVLTKSNYIVLLKDMLGAVIKDFNNECTYATGIAEPLSILTFTHGTDVVKTSTDENGVFKLYSYDKFLTGYNWTIKVEQDQREFTGIYDFQKYPKNTLNVLEEVESPGTISTDFLYKSITMTRGMLDLNLTLTYDPMLNRLVITGINSSNKDITWTGMLKIHRLSLGEKL